MLLQPRSHLGARDNIIKVGDTRATRTLVVHKDVPAKKSSSYLGRTDGLTDEG